MFSTILAIFMIGLTAGGLSCLAVQGGLLASSVGYQVDTDLRQQAETRKQTRRKAASWTPAAFRAENEQIGKRSVQVIVFFLGTKLLSYTLLGFILGWLGSILQLTPLLRGLLQLAVGVFMLGTALRMLNVHPLFRYFVFEPPAFLTRYIRQKAKQDTSLLAPVFLGFLTIFIPCGVTQTAMAMAIGTGSPVFGAAIMFAFTLGASPLFFLLAYLATQLGALMEQHFARFVAVALLVLSVLSLEGGLNLMGSPYSFRALRASLAEEQQPLTEVTVPPAGNELTIWAAGGFGLGGGYEPTLLRARANEPIRLNLVTENTFSCTRAFVIPALGIQQILPETGTVTLDLPPQPAGTVLRFTCSMGMYGGQIVFEAVQ
ncbi:MAG: hypothetical protein Fur0022_00790 [Anaerolineales bacterium]